MRAFLILTFLFLAPFAVRADEVSGTLTMERGFVVFRAGSVEAKYDGRMVPGLKAINFEKKTITKGNEETDVSELILETNAGEKITLVMSQPEPITRITEGTSVRWLPIKK